MKMWELVSMLKTFYMNVLKLGRILIDTSLRERYSCRTGSRFEYDAASRLFEFYFQRNLT